MKSQKTIELNGNLYDTATGKILGRASSPRTSNGNNIDGFFRSRASASAVHKTTHQATDTTVVKVVATPAAPKVVRTTTANHAKAHVPQPSKRVSGSAEVAAVTVTASSPQKTRDLQPNHAKAHKPQPAVTLMRTAVQKPDPSFKKQVNVQTALAAKTPSLIEIKHTVATVDPDRLVRATTTSTSPMVSHHAREHHKPSIAVAPLAVVPVPVKPEGTVPPTVPAPLPPSNNPAPQGVIPQDIFEHALANASNFLDVREHRAHFRKHARKHVLSMAAGTLALLLIALFAFYQNSPSLQVKVAGARAGVSTHLPNFAAAGYSYGGVKQSSGTLTLGFHDELGNYQLIERSTSWSGTDMVQNVASVTASGKPNYNTMHVGDTTIYRFSNTNATWVSGGTWYNLTGNSALTNDQVRTLFENL